jgi:acetylornithine deacetylase/succinyl-diaminopimelate desuccinylase-like protein
VVLYYGHYDVQPVDPLEHWTSPPFEPTLREGRMYARGAQDNKGQFFSALKAIEMLGLRRALRPTLKIVIEGDEESGSMPVLQTLRGMREALRADVVMASDTNTVPGGAPTITMGLRGILHLGLALHGPHHDLHSGVHGGAAPNPATGIARLLATLHDADGRVAVEGFYDGVRDPSPRERALAHAVPFDPERYRQATGVAPVAGERDFTPVERTGFRPVIDVNGVHSGYGGAGMKTIIPAVAIAKLSVRLVPDQDPEGTLDALERHLRRHVPPGLRLEILERGIGGTPFRADPDSTAIALAQRVLDELDPRKAVFLWEGASVPILARLPELAGGEPLLVGFGSEEDNVHAPDESYSIEQFRRGYRFIGLFLSRLARS